MGFWDKMEGAAKWITDPKQLLTGVGFALGGPPGAAAGRTVGGAIPQPWGDRPSSLEGKGDLGRLLRDAAEGYGAGVVGQQVPGIQNLEGAFAGAAAPGAVAPMTGGPGGLSEAAQSAWGQQLGGAGVTPMTGGAGGLSPAAQGAWHQQLGSAATPELTPMPWSGGATPVPTPLPGGPTVTPGIGDLTPMAQEAGSMPPWMQQTMDRATGPGAPFEVPNLASNFNAQFSGQAGVQRALGEGSGSVIDKIGDKVGGFWGDLSGLEKAYLAAQIVPPITEAISGDRDRWSEGGTDLFAEQYASHPQGRTPRSYSDWSRGR